jgi:hypothetical protein
MGTDRGTIRLVIGGLVVLTVAMLVVVAVISLDSSAKDVPDSLWTLLGVGVGALSSMLTRTSSADPAPAPLGDGE